MTPRVEGYLLRVAMHARGGLKGRCEMHTKEPWEVRRAATWWANHTIYKHWSYEIVGVGTPFYGGGKQEWQVCCLASGEDATPPDDIDEQFASRVAADARRIVACVNACAGIPTEALEAGILDELLTATDELQCSMDGPDARRVRSLIARLSPSAVQP